MANINTPIIQHVNVMISICHIRNSSLRGMVLLSVNFGYGMDNTQLYVASAVTKDLVRTWYACLRFKAIWDMLC